MELRHLRYFAAVAEERNIRQAAARLHLSGQKDISTQTTTSGYMLLFRGTHWDKVLSPEEIQGVMSRWTAWFDRLTQQGQAKAGQPAEPEAAKIDRNTPPPATP